MKASELVNAINKMVDLSCEDAEISIVNEDGFHIETIEEVYFECVDNNNKVCIEIGCY